MDSDQGQKTFLEKLTESRGIDSELYAVCGVNGWTAKETQAFVISEKGKAEKPVRVVSKALDVEKDEGDEPTTSERGLQPREGLSSWKCGSGQVSTPGSAWDYKEQVMLAKCHMYALTEEKLSMARGKRFDRWDYVSKMMRAADHLRSPGSCRSKYIEVEKEYKIMKILKGRSGNGLMGIQLRFLADFQKYIDLSSDKNSARYVLDDRDRKATNPLRRKLNLEFKEHGKSDLFDKILEEDLLYKSASRNERNLRIIATDNQTRPSVSAKILSPRNSIYPKYIFEKKQEIERESLKSNGRRADEQFGEMHMRETFTAEKQLYGRNDGPPPKENGGERSKQKPVHVAPTNTSPGTIGDDGDAFAQLAAESRREMPRTPPPGLIFRAWEKCKNLGQITDMLAEMQKKKDRLNESRRGTTNPTSADANVPKPGCSQEGVYPAGRAPTNDQPNRSAADSSRNCNGRKTAPQMQRPRAGPQNDHFSVPELSQVRRGERPLPKIVLDPAPPGRGNSFAKCGEILVVRARHVYQTPEELEEYGPGDLVPVVFEKRVGGVGVDGSIVVYTLDNKRAQISRADVVGKMTNVDELEGSDVAFNVIRKGSKVVIGRNNAWLPNKTLTKEDTAKVKTGVYVVDALGMGWVFCRRESAQRAKLMIVTENDVLISSAVSKSPRLIPQTIHTPFKTSHQTASETPETVKRKMESATRHQFFHRSPVRDTNGAGVPPKRPRQADSAQTERQKSIDETRKKLLMYYALIVDGEPHFVISESPTLMDKNSTKHKLNEIWKPNCAIVEPGQQGAPDKEGRLIGRGDTVRFDQKDFGEVDAVVVSIAENLLLLEETSIGNVVGPTVKHSLDVVSLTADADGLHRLLQQQMGERRDEIREHFPDDEERVEDPENAGPSNKRSEFSSGEAESVMADRVSQFRESLQGRRIEKIGEFLERGRSSKGSEGAKSGNFYAELWRLQNDLSVLLNDQNEPRSKSQLLAMQNLSTQRTIDHAREDKFLGHILNQGRHQYDQMMAASNRQHEEMIALLRTATTRGTGAPTPENGGPNG